MFIGHANTDILRLNWEVLEMQFTSLLLPYGKMASLIEEIRFFTQEKLLFDNLFISLMN